MPRKPRIETAGYHHIVNRGVARGDIFLKDDDFKKFLEILKNAKEIYNFIVHSFCLMKNHYHLLIETKSENLSLIARQINSKYAQYFNKKYERVGPLWQGRFKNIFVYDDTYLSVLFRYIEQNPIKADIVDKIGLYRWSSSCCILKKSFDDLLDGSMLKDKEFYNLLKSEITDKDMIKLQELENTKYKKGEQPVRLRQKPLEFYFNNAKDTKTRNKKIKEAVLDGYKQSEIADFLGVSRTTVSKAIKNE
jgi:REP element-mobilizing transposase RayT/DNA-binding CsgD family transcriptional regulator